jgi:hypothetical protein
MILDGTSPLAQISNLCRVVVAASTREAREVYASSRVLKLKDLPSQVFETTTSDLFDVVSEDGTTSLLSGESTTKKQKSVPTNPNP